MPQNSSPSPTVPIATVREIFALWASLYSNSRAVLDDKRTALIRKALATHGEPTVRDAIRGCAHSRFHMGENDRGKKYTSIELILRDAKHIEQFAGYYDERETTPTEDRVDVQALRDEGGVW